MPRPGLALADSWVGFASKCARILLRSGTSSRSWKYTAARTVTARYSGYISMLGDTCLDAATQAARCDAHQMGDFPIENNLSVFIITRKIGT